MVHNVPNSNNYEDTADFTLFTRLILSCFWLLAGDVIDLDMRSIVVDDRGLKTYGRYLIRVTS